MKRPRPGEWAPFHDTYMAHVPKRGAIDTLLKKAFRDAQTTFGALSETQGDFAYEPGKWTVKQLLIHLIDAERVFAFRTLWFMRGDRAPLPGFNQDHWMEWADTRDRTVNDLLKEWKHVRQNTLFLFEQCSEAQSQMTGVASTVKVSVRACFCIILGHQLAHMHTFRARYLPHLMP
jgi:DinB superfamily